MESIWQGAFCSALREGALWIKFKDYTKYHGLWGDGTGTEIRDVYKGSRATTRELFGQMKSQLGWRQEHHLANAPSLARHRKLQNLLVELGRIS